MLPSISKSSSHLTPKDLNCLSPAVIWPRRRIEIPESTLSVGGLRIGSLWVDFKPKQEIVEWKNARDSFQCPLKAYFWEEFSRRLQQSPCHDGGWPSAIGSSEPMGEVPPAFGGHGLCYTCQNLDRLYWENWRYPSWVVPHKRRCICATFRRDKQSKHFFMEELDEFFNKIQRYGIHRRPFTTGYSLGLGPADIQTGDSVWLLEGAEVPMVLRPVEDHYILIGSCYLHAAEREFDVCGICRASNSRYQPLAVPPIPQTVPYRPPPSGVRLQMTASQLPAQGGRYGHRSRPNPKSATRLSRDGLETLRPHWSMPISMPFEWEVITIH
ncbi:hypothetical protein FGG08_005226 [Glutinoglossum americanum]|uniref:Uncharacterized protein n=1 Tax=Glutinoglossum americanum TaxID=1670608 RepID=A0A9P8KYQ7_9PEZI|nr:hypothetical protein FGG08_005226 [Glutinoglossum americanum]